MPEDPLESSVVDLMKGWLTDCKKHKLCNTSMFDSLPSRVIDIDSRGTADDLRLADSSTIQCLNNNYATLSHCWGQVERTTTTSGNLAQMLQGFSMSSLNPMFRDAVLVARALAIRYLWIDSICIVQNSEADKSQELSKMAAIFANSQITIAGPAATDSQKSFLDRRVSDHVQVGHPGQNLYLRKALDQDWEDIQNSTLAQRAWTFQEIQLSKRMLYFLPERLMWVCREGTQWESMFTQAIDLPFNHPRVVILEPKRRTLYDGLYSVYGLSGEDNSTIDKTRLQPMSALNWYALVDEYSGRRLTFASDKLTAISAIAQSVIRYTGASYTAGLWQHEIINGLLWVRSLQSAPEKGERRLVRLEKSGTPSWSWAAYDGKVYTLWCQPQDRDTTFAVVNNVRTFPLDPQYDTGPVSSATLLLSGPCANICFWHPEDQSLAEGKVFSWYESDGGRIEDDEHYATVTFDLASEELARTPAVCMAIRRSEMIISCLVLRPDPDNDEHYIRVGCGTISTQNYGRSQKALDYVSDPILRSPPWHWKTATIN
jgi:hypothetical protein